MKLTKIKLSGHSNRGAKESKNAKIYWTYFILKCTMEILV